MTTQTYSDGTKQIIGENMKRLREASGESVELLSGRAGIARGYWYQVEAGTENVTVDTLDLIARVLGVTSTALTTPQPKKRRTG